MNLIDQILLTHKPISRTIIVKHKKLTISNLGKERNLLTTIAVSMQPNPKHLYNSNIQISSLNVFSLSFKKYQ